MSLAPCVPQFHSSALQAPSPGPCLLELLRHVLVFLGQFPGDLTAEGTNKVGCFLSAGIFISSLVPSGGSGPSRVGNLPTAYVASFLHLWDDSRPCFQAAPWTPELRQELHKSRPPPGWGRLRPVVERHVKAKQACLRISPSEAFSAFQERCWP